MSAKDAADAGVETRDLYQALVEPDMSVLSPREIDEHYVAQIGMLQRWLEATTSTVSSELFKMTDEVMLSVRVPVDKLDPHLSIALQIRELKKIDEVSGVLDLRQKLLVLIQDLYSNIGL